MPAVLIAKAGRWLAACVLLLAGAAQAAPIVVTDVAGRQVTLPQPAKRVILADARALLALNILHPQQPLKNIIAWDNSLKVKAPDLVEAYAKNFRRSCKSLPSTTPTPVISAWKARWCANRT